MHLRPKVFFTLLALFLLPLILVSAFSYLGTRRLARRGGDSDLEIARFCNNVDRLIDRQEAELVSFARAAPILELAQSRPQPTATTDDEPLAKLRELLDPVLRPDRHLVAITGFNQDRRQIFFAETRANELVIRQKDFFPGQLQPDERVWTSTVPVRSQVARNTLRASLQVSVPVLASEAARPVGAVIGEVELDSLLREAAVKSADGSVAREIVVTDDSGTILYHPNQALLHQQLGASPDASRLTSQLQIPDLNLFVAEPVQASGNLSSEQVGIESLILSFLLASVAAFLVARYWERRNSGMEKVTAGVAAIARGDLNHRIDARSSDAIRPISDNLNLMTAQLREQIARETEARQFQSFVRLSAMLTHDLKNAIEALSLIVSNMERHFDNAAFRADAMQSLNIATQNLRSLVSRLTNPVTTLSGEYKRPQPVDLVPLLLRVIKLTAEPALSKQQIVMNLPASLPALVDAERIEKVIENLILNAVEAMSGKEGLLTVAAGPAEDGKVFFSVTDTGEGISATFIEKQLFRPFATTKRSGVGLGLYTCREVVRANGGSIEVDSIEGAGTTFRVVLPSAAS